VVWKTFVQLLGFIFVPIFLLIIAGPDLIAVVFGEAWRTAGLFLAWMAPRIMVQFISSPLSSIFLVLNRQDLNLKIDGLLFLSNLGLVMVGGLLNNYLLAIQLLGIGTFICYLTACLLIFKTAGISYGLVAGRIARTFLQAVPYILPPLLTVIFADRSWLTVAVAVSCGCIFLVLNARKFGRFSITA
jgi:O-antigen/teichoic acid export membrane protein